MNKYKKIIKSVCFIALTGGILLFYKFDAASYIGIKNNVLDVNFDSAENISGNVSIYFLSRSNGGNQLFDTTLLYQNSKIIADIPDAYGENGMLVEYKNIDQFIPMQYKFKPWHKHTYVLEFMDQNNKLLINWKVEGKYKNSGFTFLILTKLYN